MFPFLETGRFLLVKIEREDQAFIFKGLSDPAIIKYYGIRYDNYEATSAQMDFYENLWKEKTGCWWKIIDRISMEAMGACGMNYYNPVDEKAEVGYWLLPLYWKKAVMTEVLPVMIHHLFSSWKLNRLEAVIEEGNEASCRLSEKMGFIFEGTCRECEIKNGRRINLLMYSLLRIDYEKRLTANQ
ncbi:MAG TPA: GNAT family protein [Chitinophagaceae bacterium]|nr:GNAT family protein [Chitinophagaceae bacterium]